MQSPAVAAGEPFPDTESAWIWCALSQTARSDGALMRAGLAAVDRPCEPIDIIKSVDRLYRNRRLMSEHLEVLVRYGQRSSPPDGTWRAEAADARLWTEAIDRLELVLRRKGIVA